MKVYFYDETTKEFTAESEARKDPKASQRLGKDVWLLPANSTFDRPPIAEDGKAVIFDDGWKQVVDNRGKTAVNADRGIFEIDYLGEKEGDTIVTAEMQKGLDDGTFVVEQGRIVEKPRQMKAAERRLERNMLIAATDKYMFVDYPISEEERELYRQYRQYLRDVPEQEDFPDEAIKTFEEWKGA